MKNWRAETRDAGQLFPELESDSQRLLKNTTGILPSQHLEHYIKTKTIRSDFRIEKEQVQPASIDLRLGRKAYRVQASFLPGKKSTVASKIDKFRMHEIDLSAPTVLEKGCVYIVRLMEELSLPADIWGKANPKSTTGRLIFLLGSFPTTVPNLRQYRLDTRVPCTSRSYRGHLVSWFMPEPN